ncbi:MAG: methyltransferase domain-containing protein [Alphaproteobacteria bacterium]|nr:methyltransferase domain-containing protein [Alphaproteobacteria bacterium]
MRPTTLIRTRGPMSPSARAKPTPAQRFADDLDRVIRLRAAGQGREALAICERLAASAPDHADVHHLLGILIFEAGDHRGALRAIDRALTLAPDRADFFNSKGIISRALGDRPRAIEAFARALKLAPGLAEGHNNLGALLLDSAARTAAIAEFREALRLQPDYADAALNLALALAPIPEGRVEALRRFQGLLDNARLARAAFDGLINLGTTLRAEELPPWFVDLVAERLARGDAITRALEACAWRIVVARRQGRSELAIDPLERTVLARCLASSPEAEQFVIAQRDRALALATEGRAVTADELETVAATALQAGLSSYAQVALDGEAVQVARLRAQIETRIAANEAPPADLLALYAVFAPLVDIAGADRIAQMPAEHWPAAVRPLLRRALVEPLIERAIVPKIHSLGPSEDATSKAVGAQYEAHPYPRWIATEIGPRRPLGALLRDHLPAVDVPRAFHGPVEILVAGCGTGWSVVHAALSYQGAQVLGVDLSRTSLAYGWREIAARKLDNAAMVQGDILGLARLGRRFDYVVSGGVLHHMADPLAGWRALVDCLAPDGLMQIGLYSELGRRTIVVACDAIAASGESVGLAAGDDAIRAFRRRVLEEGPDGPLAPLTRFADFYDLNGCRDLLFNEVEHRFDLERLEAALEALGLEFLGFNLASPEIARAYVQRFPDDPLMRSLPNWQAFEADNPDTFAAMYQFWCRRRPVDNQTERA